jgi:hypothetical protein
MEVNVEMLHDLQWTSENFPTTCPLLNVFPVIIPELILVYFVLVAPSVLLLCPTQTKTWISDPNGAN